MRAGGPAARFHAGIQPRVAPSRSQNLGDLGRTAQDASADPAIIEPGQGESWTTDGPTRAAAIAGGWHPSLTIIVSGTGLALATTQAGAGGVSAGQRTASALCWHSVDADKPDYTIASHTTDMSPAREQAVFRNAFDIWQSATPLRFTQVATGGDFNIYFLHFETVNSATGSSAFGYVEFNDD